MSIEKIANRLNDSFIRNNWFVADVETLVALAEVIMKGGRR